VSGLAELHPDSKPESANTLYRLVPKGIMIFPPEIIFNYGVKRIHAVLSIDFLTFSIRPATVANAYLVYSAAAPGELGDHFELNTTTIFFDLNRFDRRKFNAL
jgi:hypothetical protein